MNINKFLYVFDIFFVYYPQTFFFVRTPPPKKNLDTAMAVNFNLPRHWSMYPGIFLSQGLKDLRFELILRNVLTIFFYKEFGTTIPELIFFTLGSQ